MRAPTGTAEQWCSCFFRNGVGARIARLLSEFVQNFEFTHLLYVRNPTAKLSESGKSRNLRFLVGFRAKP